MRSSSDPSTRRSAFALACACALGVAPAALAPAAEPQDPSASERLLGSLQSRYEGIGDVSAEFVQEAFVASLGRHDVSHGHVVMQRPGRMRWEYDEPEKRVIVLDGGTLRVYTPSEAQLQIASAAGGGFSPTALGFLLGEGDLRSDFASERLEAPEREEIGVRLRPRGDAAFEHLEMWLEPESHQLRESVVVDVFGNRTSVRFSQVTENVGVADGAFEIAVPEGTEVIDLR